MMTSTTVTLFIIVTCARGAAVAESKILKLMWGRRGVCRTAVQHGVLVPKLSDTGFLAEGWLFVECESQIG